MPRFRIMIACLFAGLLLPAVGRSAEIIIGIFSLDLVIPGTPDSPGVNAFTIGNLTGDPSSGGSAVPPTFPVETPLTFLNSSLLVTSGALTTPFALGDITPGFFGPPELQFPDTAIFSSAVFSATLNQSTLRLEGGGRFTVSAPVISAALLPSAGDALVPGVDLVLITVSAEPAPVPEPVSFTLLPLGVAFGFWLRRRCLVP